MQTMCIILGMYCMGMRSGSVGRGWSNHRTDALIHGPMGEADACNLKVVVFQTHIKDMCFEHFQNRPRVNATRPYWWLVNIGSGNDLKWCITLIFLRRYTRPNQWPPPINPIKPTSCIHLFQPASSAHPYQPTFPSPPLPASLLHPPLPANLLCPPIPASLLRPPLPANLRRPPNPATPLHPPLPASLLHTLLPTKLHRLALPASLHLPPLPTSYRCHHLLTSHHQQHLLAQQCINPSVQATEITQI